MKHAMKALLLLPLLFCTKAAADGVPPALYGTYCQHFGSPKCARIVIISKDGIHHEDDGTCELTARQTEPGHWSVTMACYDGSPRGPNVRREEWVKVPKGFSTNGGYYMRRLLDPPS